MIGNTTIHGPEGEQYQTYTTKRWPLGTKLELQDGRTFRFFLNGAGALTAGKLIQSPVPGANFDELVVPAAVPIGTRELTVTNGATTVTADEFADGYINVEDDTGEGHLYAIAGNDAEAAGSAALVLRVKRGIILAWTTSTTVGLSRNPFASAIVHPSPPTARLLGVVPVAVAAAAYGWVQTKGPASVLTEGTLIIGLSAQASETTDGCVSPFRLTEAAPPTELAPVVGIVMEVAATTEHSLIYLKLE